MSKTIQGTTECSAPEEAGGASRRLICLSVIYGLGAAIAAALGLPAFAYLLFPPKSVGKSEWVDAGSVRDLRVAEPRGITFRRTQTDGWKIRSEKATSWVVRTPSGEVVAYSPWCTHLGCAYHWDARQEQFLCPCHGSVFSVDGKVVAGPAPRALDRYEVKVEGDELWLGPLKKA